MKLAEMGRTKGRSLDALWGVAGTTWLDLSKGAVRPH